MLRQFSAICLGAAMAMATPSLIMLHTEKYTTGPVPIELFVMSKCPDKVYCESVMARVLQNVTVPFSLDVNYIARPNPEQPLKIDCMHGPTECAGNIQELCFKHIYPEVDDWFAFDLCMNQDYQWIGVGDKLARHCALKISKDYEPVDACATGEVGLQLLADSVARTQSLGVSKSCTIYINNELRCVRDGGWKECDGGHEVSDFVKTIEDAYVEPAL